MKKISGYLGSFFFKNNTNEYKTRNYGFTFQFKGNAFD